MAEEQERKVDLPGVEPKQGLCFRAGFNTETRENIEIH